MHNAICWRFRIVTFLHRSISLSTLRTPKSIWSVRMQQAWSAPCPMITTLCAPRWTICRTNCFPQSQLAWKCWTTFSVTGVRQLWKFFRNFGHQRQSCNSALHFGSGVGEG
jgi:hypothetical protein